MTTPDTLQSKMLLTIDKRGSKIARNSVFIAICSHLGNIWQSKTLFLTIFLSRFFDSINIFDCRLSSVVTVLETLILTHFVKMTSNLIIRVVFLAFRESCRSGELIHEDHTSLLSLFHFGY